MLILGFRAWAEEEAKRVREHAKAFQGTVDRDENLLDNLIYQRTINKG